MEGGMRCGRAGGGAEGGREGECFCSSSSPSAVRCARQLRRGQAEHAAERSGTKPSGGRVKEHSAVLFLLAALRGRLHV